MNKLIFALTFLPILASAEVQEISDTKIKNKFLTLVKDAEVEKMVGSTAEFQKCRKDGESKASDPKNVKDANLVKATDCFKKAITGKNAEALKKLADDLNLQDYGLIKSKNVSEITNYLSKKMIKSLTGRDPDEKDPAKILEQMKWENRKIVDQKIFIDLYTNQLMKSALFEVSRFCFENLRFTNSNENNFADHWATVVSKDYAVNVKEINDKGEPSFLEGRLDKIDVSDKNNQAQVIQKMAEGLSKGKKIDPLMYENFFGYCQKALPLLCNEFKDDLKNKYVNTSVQVDPTKGMTNGANACLTVDRLKAIRIGMKKTELVAKQFEEMGEDKDKFALRMITNPKFYEGGNGADEESLDEMTSYSSADMLADQKKNDFEKLQNDCLTSNSPECDEFLVKSDSVDNAINKVELSMNMKRELELERVKQMKNNKDDLQKYLEEAGHYELINELSKNPNFDLEDGLRKIYEARKVAEIEALKLKVGKRQVSEEEHKTISDNKETGKKIVENIKDAKEERVRIAQVMMFTNIITSQLKLTDKATNKEVGRNVSGWKKELADLDKTGAYDPTLFDGVKESADKHGSQVENTSVVGGEIIEAILGKESK